MSINKCLNYGGRDERLSFIKFSKDGKIRTCILKSLLGQIIIAFFLKINCKELEL